MQSRIRMRSINKECVGVLHCLLIAVASCSEDALHKKHTHTRSARRERGL